jgi:glycosyltransferase involved in cell wall biosynthesis
MAEFQGGVTVLMPVYNCAEYIGAAIGSVLNQSYRDFELLIVDDGSTDDSVKVAGYFKDSRIRIHSKHHTGLADSLNEGIKLIRSDWVARLDADDIAAEDRLRLQAEYLSNHNDTDVTAGYSVYFSGKKKIEFTVRPPSEDEDIRLMLNIHNPINHSTVTFRKNKIFEAGGYDASMKCFEDFELWLRLKEDLKFHIMPEYLAFTRMRSDSMTATAGYESIYRLLMKNYSGLNSASYSKEYLKELKFRIEFFYGNKDRAREIVPQLSDFKTMAAYLTTMLPEESFNKLKHSRLRYRLSLGKTEKKVLESRLEAILNQSELQ